MRALFFCPCGIGILADFLEAGHDNAYRIGLALGFDCSSVDEVFGFLIQIVNRQAESHFGRRVIVTNITHRETPVRASRARLARLAS